MQCYRALVQLAEKRDQETGTHLARIGEYVYRLANRLELPRRYVENLRVFSQFHDIGKVGIPDQILLAPRRLTPDEFEIMKTHTTLGWQILKDVETMELAAETALTHHEHYDGTGYPQSLKGEAIPISGRITAIADVYDALRSSRPYKEAWTRERAAEYIRSQGGSQFDPRLSKLFAEIESEFNTIFMEGK
jgi:response regulator RpfG family c-di-GMP phosphodiesterase